VARPIDPEELIIRLESLWPDVAPHPEATDKQIQQQIGAVQVVRYLRAELLSEDDGTTVFAPGFNTGRP
jgi:hypothetical protein